MTPRESGNIRLSTANDPPITACRMSLALALRPSERALEILVQSSRNPTNASPTNRYMASSPDADGARQKIRCESPYPRTTAITMMMPPMVGVPRLVWCSVGPSSRMN